MNESGGQVGESSRGRVGRIGRLIYALIVVISLALCIATIVQWRRTFKTASVHEFSRNGKLWEIKSLHGSIVLDNEPQRALEDRPRVLAEMEAARLAYNLDNPDPGGSRTIVSTVMGSFGVVFANRSVFTLGSSPSESDLEKEILGRLKQLGYAPKVKRGQTYSSQFLWRLQVDRTPKGMPVFVRTAPAPVLSPPKRLAIPHVAIAGFFALLPLRSLWRGSRRVARSMRGHCVVCGYDLRFSGERCPECGTIARARRDASRQPSAGS